MHFVTRKTFKSHFLHCSYETIHIQVLYNRNPFKRQLYIWPLNISTSKYKNDARKNSQGCKFEYDVKPQSSFISVDKTTEHSLKSCH